MLTANNALVNWKSLKSAPAGRPAGVKLLRTVRQIGGGEGGNTVFAATTATSNNN